MKRTLLSILVIGILLLSACGPPTTSPPPSSTEQSSTSSETASPEQEKPSLSEATYTLWLLWHTEHMNEAGDIAIEQLLENPQLESQQWRDEIEKYLAAWPRLIEQAEEKVPPPSMLAFHQDYLESLQHIQTAGELIRKGIDEQDYLSIDEAYLKYVNYVVEMFATMANVEGSLVEEEVSLSISISPSGAGSVSPSDGQHEEGTRVTLTATPASGYTFDYWDGDASGSSATITVIMDSDKSVTAHFVDMTPPVISGVDISCITESSATINWATHEPTTSQVEYGTTDACGSTTSLDEELTTSHSVGLSGLEPNTAYHFRVRSKDASGNEDISSGYSFMTIAPTREVSGVILTDTTWTGGYIYIITGKVGIEKGVCLIIEPGTVVKFEPAGMLQIKGTLKAEGLPGNRITFTTTPEQGEWKGIVLLEGSTNSIISYTIIEGRALCIYAGGEAQVNITHNIIRKSSIGMHIGDWKGTIAYNKIHLNGRGVSYCARYGGELSYNTITDNEVGIDNSGPTSQGGITLNNIFANHQFNLKQWGGTGGEVNASNNWWGTTDESLIQESIYDYYDDFTLPKVIYKPYATAPISEAPLSKNNS